MASLFPQIHLNIYGKNEANLAACLFTCGLCPHVLQWVIYCGLPFSHCSCYEHDHYHHFIAFKKLAKITKHLKGKNIMGSWDPLLQIALLMLLKWESVFMKVKEAFLGICSSFFHSVGTRLRSSIRPSSFSTELALQNCKDYPIHMPQFMRLRKRLERFETSYHMHLK